MIKYSAFLRGINVGGRTIKMNELKACLSGAGYKNVSTLLQSGNVVFESDKSKPLLKNEMESLLSRTFNYPAKVQIVSLEELAQIIKDYPFKIREGYHNYVIFLENGLEHDLAGETTLQPEDSEQIAAGKGVVYWQVKQGQTLKSNFGKLLTKSKYREFNTNRNLNTLTKLVAK